MRKPSNLTQTVIKTSAVTLFVAFVTFAYGLAVFGYVAPKVMANLCDTLGAYNAAGMYYERVYNNQKTPENAYIALDRYIIVGNNKKTIQYAEKFFGSESIFEDEYPDLIQKINAKGREQAKNKYELLSWGNEDSRIKSAYTVALLSADKISIAKARLNEWLSGAPNLEQPNHAFFAFVAKGKATNDVKAEFEEYVENFDQAFDFASFSGESIFAIDFLRIAHTYLGNAAEASYYAELFNGLSS